MPLSPFTVSVDSKLAVYRQIAEHITHAATTGQLQPGDCLPAGAKLARTLGVNPLTVHRAYDLLASNGIVLQKRGSGTYLTENVGASQSPGHRNASGRRPSCLSATLEHIVIVVGASHLARCSRDVVRLVTEMLQGVHDILGDRKVSITYADSLTHQALGHLQAGSAVLVKHASQVDPTVHQMLLDRGVPVVGVLNSAAPLPLPQVGFDIHEAVRLSCEHLIACGYRRIGYIGCMGGKVELGAKFLEFTNVMYRAGLDFQIRHVRDVPNQPGRAYAATAEIIKGGDLPEAFFVETDYRAMEVVAALAAHGLRVPEDMGVSSMDDVADACLFDPPLTTTRTPQREIGQCVTRMVLDFIEHRTPLFSSTPRPQLQIRQSTCSSAAVPVSPSASLPGSSAKVTRPKI